MTTIGGVSSYGVIISSAQSSGPSGDIVYLCAISASGMEKFMQKIKELTGGSSYSNRDGKYSADVTITDCYVVKHVEATNTAEFNTIMERFRDWHAAGDAPIYLWLYNFVDADYIAIGHEGTAPKDYMTGFITDVQWDVAHGNLYKFKSIKFKRCIS